MPSTKQLRRDDKRKRIAGQYRLLVVTSDGITNLGTAAVDLLGLNPFFNPAFFDQTPGTKFRVSKRTWCNVTLMPQGLNAEVRFYVGMMLLNGPEAATAFGDRYPDLQNADEVASAYERKRLLMWEHHMHTRTSDGHPTCTRADCDGTFTISVPPVAIDPNHVLQTWAQIVSTGSSSSRVVQKAKYWYKEL